jgi:DNA-binding response OmpR family regulator
MIPTCRRVLADALKDNGYVVDSAGDGVEGHYLGEIRAL